MANKQLTAKVRLNSSQAEQKLKNIARAVDKINRAVGKNSNLYGKVSSELAKVEQQTKKVAQSSNKISAAFAKIHAKGLAIRTKVAEWVTQQNKVNNSARTTNSLFGSIWSKLKGIAATYLGVMGLRSAIQTTDTITSAENKFNYLNGGNTAETQQTMDKMYNSAQKVRMGYTDMMANVSKSMTLAGSAFNDNVDNAIRFQEIMAEAYAVGGASAAEMSSSMYQMIQALGSGILQGDELRSVREGAPLAYKAIEEFAQGVYNTEESLKELASQGKITSEIVVAAIMNAGNEMDTAFAQTQQTFAQTWTQIKNMAIMAFKPVANMLRDELNEAIGNGLLDKLETVFVSVSKALQIIGTVVINTIYWIADNWDWLQHLIVGGLLIMAGMWIWQAGVAIIAFISMILALTPLQWTLLTILGVILALVYIYYLWRNAAIDSCTAIGLALIALAGIVFLLFGWQAALIVALVGVVIMALDWVCGAVLGGISIIWNLFVMLVTLILQNAILPLTIAWDSFANFLANIFVDPISTIINLFTGLGDTVLSILETIARGIDAIFGSNLASAVSGWRDSLGGWSDKLVAKYGNGKYDQKSDLTGKVNELLHNAQASRSWNTKDAFNTGKDFGAGIQNKINSVGSKFQGGGSQMSLLDSLGDKLGLTFNDSISSHTPINPTMPEYGALGGLDPDELGKGVGNIDKNTGSMADSMELTQEDLAYLRDIANMEWKKEFTTAQIQVDMSNYNTVNGDGDLDGIVTRLADRLYEELDSVANGVYAY